MLNSYESEQEQNTKYFLGIKILTLFIINYTLIKKDT